jgi:Domain of unknown function (DUF4129)
MMRRRRDDNTRACAPFGVALSFALRAVAIVALAALARPAAASSSFDDYRTRVDTAFERSGELRAALSEDDYGTDDAAAARAVAALRDALPQRERVEGPNGSVEVDNGWLYKELDSYGRAPDAAHRREIATRLRERLGALKRELDAAAASSRQARDKEAEKGRLQSILNRPEYNEQAARGGALGRLWERIKEFLSRLIPRSKPLSSGTAGVLSLVARVFIYALAVAAIVFVLWRFGPGAWARVTARRRKSQEREARVILGERLEADETASDLIAAAERLARAGDLRGAIRKAYVAVLCELGDRKVIRLARHKTNRDYLANVRDRAELYDALRPLTQNFERHWYGLAPATPSDWDEYRSLCNQAMRY